MSNFIVVKLDDNTKIYLETAKDDIKEDGGLFVPILSSGHVIEKTKDFLNNTFEQIKIFSNGISNAVKNMDASPDEVEVDFSVKFSADVGIIISSASSETGITIKMKWKKSQER